MSRTKKRVTHEPSSEKTLEARGVTVRFEGLTALEDVNLAVHPGEILGLIGPNGAGKTTLLNVLSGFVEQTEGSIFIEGENITDWSPDRRARGGIGRSFQGMRLFSELTVLENIETGVLCTGVARREARRRARALAARMNLTAPEDAPARALPAGDQHLVGVLRALASDPKFLLLDEPAAGLNETESDQLVSDIRAIRDEFDCAILLIDHDMRVIMPLCERIQVLNYGATICVGTPDTVRTDPGVIQAYLGSSGESENAEG